MKKIGYSCFCGNIFEFTIVEKGDKILIQDRHGQRYEAVVDNPYDYPPCPEACPECNVCPSDEFIESFLR